MSLAEYNYKLTTKRPEQDWDAKEYTIQVKPNSGTFSKDSSQGSVAYLCEYNYHERFLDTILGKTVKTVHGPLVRSASSPEFDATNGSTPEEHPYYYNFFASSAEVEPFGQWEQTDVGPIWKKAKITVVYRPVDYNIIPDQTGSLSSGSTFTEADRYTTKTPEGQADFLTGQGKFYWLGRTQTDGTKMPLDIQPGQIIGATRYTYTWHQIPTLTVSVAGKTYPDLKTIPNLSDIAPLVGCVNAFAFDGFAPGTVLFANYSAKLIMPQVATQNNYYWDIIYTLAVRNYGTSVTPYVPDEDIGWNYAYDSFRGDWSLYTTDGLTSGNTMYPYADLNTLFDPTLF